MAPVFLSSSNWRRALFNSANRAEDRAFNALGLFRVTAQSAPSVTRGPQQDTGSLGLLSPTPGFGEEVNIFS